MLTKISSVQFPFSDNDICAIKEAAAIIQNGGLVAFPTETVYGLGADGTKPMAAEKIYAAKGRPSDNPLILHIAFPEEASVYAETSKLYYTLAQAFMPGPITIIMPAKPVVPKHVTAGLSTVAIRCPSHPIAHRLIVEAKTAIAAPSANLSGSPSPTCAKYVIDDMQGRIDMILDGGNSEIGLESTIVKIVDEKHLILLRPGAITVEQLALYAHVTIAKSVTGELQKGEVAESPGMKYRHYAPKSQFVLLEGNLSAQYAYIATHQDNASVICYTEQCQHYMQLLGENHVFDIGAEHDTATHCSRLFTLLRTADQPETQTIYASLPEKDGLGLALYNRMIRAAAHCIIKLKDN